MGTDFRERVGLAVGERDAADVSQVRKRGHKTQRTADVSQERKTRSWEPAGEGVEGRGSGLQPLILLSESVATIFDLNVRNCFFQRLYSFSRHASSGDVNLLKCLDRMQVSQPLVRHAGVSQ